MADNIQVSSTPDIPWGIVRSRCNIRVSVLLRYWPPFSCRICAGNAPAGCGRRGGDCIGGDDRDVSHITPQELQALLFGTRPPTILDVRTHSSYERDSAQIPGSIRVLPDQVTEWVENNHPEGLISDLLHLNRPGYQRSRSASTWRSRSDDLGPGRWIRCLAQAVFGGGDSGRNSRLRPIQA